MIRARLLAPLLALLLAAAPAYGESTVFVEEMTWTELRDAIAAGSTTVIVPVGGTEQNGPHMVLGKHNVRVRALAGRIARALGDALVAPVVAYVPEGAIDPPTAHMKFPGTITVPADVFERTLESAARSLRHAGFRTVVFIGDHGGYQASLERAAARLAREWAKSPAHAYAIAEYYRATESEYARALVARGYSKAEIGTHAGLADTSLALAVDPALVRADSMHAPPSAAQGAYGDPRRASADLGRIGVELIVNRTAEAIRAANSAH